MKNKLQKQLLEATDLYEAYGILTALAALGRFNVLWLNYYTWRIGRELPISDRALIEELHQRILIEIEMPPTLVSTISINDVVWDEPAIEDSCFWELIEVSNGFVLRMTTHTNVVWNPVVKTFAAQDWESALDICTAVLEIKEPIKCL
jgi:hypothetical protein